MKRTFVTLYHGTDRQAAEQIRECGFNTQLVYLTNDRAAALRYGGPDAVVLRVVVPVDKILIDFDLGADLVLCVESANSYRDEDLDVHGWLAEHGAFAVPATDAELV